MNPSSQIGRSLATALWVSGFMFIADVSPGGNDFFRIVSTAIAQQPPEPKSVMDRIRRKAEEMKPTAGENWFERLDTDRNGEVSLSEAQRSIAARFSHLDSNTDGRIDRKEYELRRRASAMSGPTFDELDSDRNEFLSSAEFGAPTLWRFGRLDVDGNGVISRTEASRYLNTPTARVLPPLAGRCFELEGRIVLVTPEMAETLQRSGRAQVDCTWRPGLGQSR